MNNKEEDYILTQTEKSFYKNLLDMQILDVMFKQHLDSQSAISVFCVGLQWIGIIVYGILITLYPDNEIIKSLQRDSVYACLILLFVVVFNGYIHTKIYQKQRDKLHDLLELSSCFLNNEMTNKDIREYLDKYRELKDKFNKGGNTNDKKKYRKIFSK